MAATCGLKPPLPSSSTTSWALTVPSMAWLMLASKEAVITATAVTRARPIISAAEVRAVRRGLRRAFSPASRPGAPRSRAGHPNTVATGRTRMGASRAAPRKIASTDSPSTSRLGPEVALAPKRVWSSPAVPPRKSSRPKPIRVRGSPWISGWASRSAATGEIRVARRAGSAAAITVMIVPTRTETISALACTLNLAVELKTWMSRSATRMPKTKPASEASTPLSAASVMTSVKTWARVAPSARSNASSWVRWATRMLKVLAIRKLPTKTAMKAKTRSGVPMNRLISVTAFCSV